MGKVVSPEPGKFKLNTDGSSLDGIATGGGLIRQGLSCGGFLIIGPGDNTTAEVLALLSGLELAHQFNIDLSWVEVD